MSTLRDRLDELPDLRLIVRPFPWHWRMKYYADDIVYYYEVSFGPFEVEYYGQDRKKKK